MQLCWYYDGSSLVLRYHYIYALILSWSYLATLNSHTILGGSWGVCTLLLNYLITPRTNHTKVCITYKIFTQSLYVLWSKKIRLNPSIRPLYKIQIFSLICKRNKLWDYWTSAYLFSCEWYIWTSILSLRFLMYSNWCHWLW